MRALAAEGRTVIVSSHFMSEMENIADHVLVMGRGRLIADCPVDEFIAAGSQRSVRVRTPQPEELSRLVAAVGGTVRADGEGVVMVSGLDTGRIWDLAFENAVRLDELAPMHASLEQAFVELTAASMEFHADAVSASTDGKGSLT
jgi:ABC-2 type transport system ATP-binding protein